MLRYVEILVEGTKVLIRTKAHDHGVPFLGAALLRSSSIVEVKPLLPQEMTYQPLPKLGKSVVS